MLSQLLIILPTKTGDFWGVLSLLKNSVSFKSLIEKIKKYFPRHSKQHAVIFQFKVLFIVDYSDQGLYIFINEISS